MTNSDFMPSWDLMESQFVAAGTVVFFPNKRTVVASRFNRYGERTGIAALCNQTPFYTRHSAGMIETARVQRQRVRHGRGVL